jgi:hypothetical protein
MEEADKRTGAATAKSVRLSPREINLIDKLRGSQPRSAWMREAILTRLEAEAGYVDQARRPMPRRENFPRTSSEEE